MDERTLPQRPPPDQREASAYGERPCVQCGGLGEHVVDSSYDRLTGLLTQTITQCLDCEGDGTLSVFLYPEGRRG